MNESVGTTLLKYDGMMGELHQYTEVDPRSASFGASFYLKTTDPEAVSRRREEKRLEFEIGLTKRV